MFPATIFDFNGVLVDDEHVHLEAFRDTVAQFGLVIGEEEYWDELLGYDDAGVFRTLLHKAKLPASDAEVARLVNEKKPLYMQRARKGLVAFPGAAELVRARSLVGPVAIVSGALTDEIVLGLESLGVQSLVGKIISAEDAPRSKPDPQGYQMGVEWLRAQIGAGAERALVFEDSLDGVTAAKAAGLPTVAVAHSYPRERLDQSGADVVFGRLAEVGAADIDALYEKLYG